MKLDVPSTTVVGQYLQLAAYSLSTAISFVYAAGYTLGTVVHQLNDNLAQFHSLTSEGKQSVFFYYTRKAYNALQS